MALDVTVGTSTANSYATVAEADAYADTLTFRTAWPATGTATGKEGALQQAARLMGSLSWKGKKVSSTQALEWPRFGVADVDGYTVDSTTIPAKVKQAQCELAVRLIAKDRAAQDPLQATRVKAGPVEVEYAAGAQPTIVPNIVTRLVSDLLKGGGFGIARVDRS